MKIFILFLFACLYYTNVSAGLRRTPLAITGGGATKMALKCQLSSNPNLNVTNIVVYFYDLRNGISKSFLVGEAAQAILSINNFNKANKFFIYVGGFKSNIRQETIKHVKHAFRYIDHSYLIIVDHSAYTHERDGYRKSYDRSVRYVPNIGKKLAVMLAGLNKGGVSPKNMHCIGHSLGGQILGYAGENFSKLTGQKISRITALDPAKPCFDKKTDMVHIRSGVADYVEIYHCNSRVLGSELSLGDVDFFVNNGKSQPQCGDASSWSLRKALKASECSHKSCVMMWTASVLYRNRYPAYKCIKYDHFKKGKCTRNKYTTAGFWNPGTATGKYYLSTDNSNF